MSEEFYPVERDVGPERVDEDEPAKKRETHERPLPLNYLLATEARQDLVDYFLTSSPDELQNKAEIARNTGLSRTTIVRHIEVLVRFGLVVKEGEERPRYKPNTESDSFEVLIAANQILSAHAREHE